MFLDFGIMAILLVIAHILRSRVSLLQNLFVPTAIIAGFLGLAGGPQGFDLLPFSDKPVEVNTTESVETDESGEPVAAEEEPEPVTEPAMTEYPFYLVVLLFATLLMGHSKKEKEVSPAEVVRNVGDTLSYNLASEIGMFALALLFGLLVLGFLFPWLDSDTSSVGGFSLLLPAGFVGGHGTANVVGTELETSGGYENALTIGYTFATVGLLAGILGGMILINLATRRGWTRMVKTAEELPESVRRGFLEEEERQSMGEQTVSPIALDPLSWHLALALVAFALAFFADDVINRLLPGDEYSLPLFAFSMLAGALLQKGLDRIGLGQFVDKAIMGRIGSATSDFLIAFGVASIKLGVVLDYWQPLLVMSLFGVIYSVALLWFIGRPIFRNFWFERSVFVYGWNTGVVAIGITLLRVVDPRLKTRTLEEFGLAYVIIAFVEIGMLVALPKLVAKGFVLVPALVLTGMFVGTILLSRWFVGWFKTPPDEMRAGEQPIVEEFGSGVAVQES
jgi:ESS family glutamate:Na+ symporter